LSFARGSHPPSDHLAHSNQPELPDAADGTNGSSLGCALPADKGMCPKNSLPFWELSWNASVLESSLRWEGFAQITIPEQPAPVGVSDLRGLQAMSHSTSCSYFQESVSKGFPRDFQGIPYWSILIADSGFFLRLGPDIVWGGMAHLFERLLGELV
jgi:hypothetical protein